MAIKLPLIFILFLYHYQQYCTFRLNFLTRLIFFTRYNFWEKVLGKKDFLSGSSFEKIFYLPTILLPKNFRK